LIQKIYAKNLLTGAQNNSEKFVACFFLARFERCKTKNAALCSGFCVHFEGTAEFQLCPDCRPQSKI
jgi:hypothetical protein